MEKTVTRETAIRTALEQAYEIRFNEAIAKLEFRERESQDPFAVVTNEGIRSLIAVLRDNGIDARKTDIFRAFNTTFVQQEKTEFQTIAAYIDTELEYRFNLIKMQPEYRADNGEWVQMTKIKINTLVLDLDAHQIKASPDKLKLLLESEYAPMVNPVKEYFEDLPVYDEVNEPDYIKQLADTVRMEIGQERWYDYFKKWLVGCVSNVFIDDRCTNQVMLVITGKQGAYKTTWLENLCPRELKKRYMFSGKIDPTNKDIETLIAECFLINIDDQLHILNKKDSEDLKNLITKSSVKYRRPYDPFIIEYPHLASFCGSINGNEFLNDPTGSRRFLPFEAASIDINAAKALDIDNVWRQAYFLFRSGFVYWFNQEEVALITQQNADFAMMSEEEQLILRLFAPAEPNEPNAVKLQPADILEQLQKESGFKNLSMKKVGAALTKLGFKKRRLMIAGNSIAVYDCIKKEIIDY